MGKRNALIVLGLINMIFLSSCTMTTKFYYKDKGYFSNRENGKLLFIDNTEQFVCDVAARAFVLYTLRLDPGQLEDTLTEVFDYVLQGLSKKYIKKIEIIGLNKFLVNEEIKSDTLKSQKIVLTSQNSISKEFEIPSRSNFDNPEIKNFNYIMQIKSPKISASRYLVPAIFPTPGGFISSSTSGPCLILHGTYVLWDYDNNKAICAGEFSKQIVETRSLLKRKSLVNTLKPLVVEIFSKTPYPLLPQN